MQNLAFAAFTHTFQFKPVVPKVLVPAWWESLRTESYFPLKEGTKLHFSST